MAALTAQQLSDEVAFRCDLDNTSGSETATSILRYLQMAGTRVWQARRWQERWKVSFLVTAVPYETGTVDVTNVSAALVGNGTTWTSAMVTEKRKFALGIGQPWYLPTTFTSVTSIALSRVYQGATALAQTYSIYQDEYDVGTDCDQIEDVQILYGPGRGEMFSLSRRAMDDSLVMPWGSGIPCYYGETTPITVGTKRIRISPVPNAVYNVRVVYLQAWTAISGSTVSPLGADRDELLINATCLLAQRLPTARNVTTQTEVAAMIEEAWRSRPGDASPRSFSRLGVDQAPGYSGFIPNVTGL